MTDQIINLMLVCAAAISATTALLLLIIRRTAWIRSRKFDAFIYLFAAITIALITFVIFR